MSIFPTRILLATDGSKEAALVARAAVDLGDKTGSELHVVHVVPFVPMPFAYTETEPAQREQEARKLLDEQVEKIEASGGTEAQAHLRMGKEAEEIVTLGEEIEAGLIVVGSRGLGGMRRVLMGSVSDSVVQHAHWPVLVVRDEEKQ
jgi:nucleotide-binding universal stress UspA family protein